MASTRLMARNAGYAPKCSWRVASLDVTSLDGLRDGLRVAMTGLVHDD